MTVVIAIVAVALISIAVVVIVARIAIPSLVKARVTANETSAIASLRSITSAQVAFSASCGSGFYAPSLARLGVPPPREGGNGFIAADLAADPVTKSRYTIVLTPGPAVATTPASCNGAPAGTLVATFFVSATPVGDVPARFFGMNQDGTIYQSTTAVPVTFSGSPAGGVPVVQ